ncbi:MAG TPA: lysine--tRNA ligase [Acidobacteriaceae bacterium]|nr:lysine--tRNA ligase [Acidobacteriaceae bacterium]
MSQFESEFERNLYAQRQEKLREISAIGQRLGLTTAESIYPNRFPAADEPIPFAHIPDLLARYDSESAPVSAETLEAEHPEFAVAGRIMSIRLQGKAGFAHLQQGGKRLQIYVRKDDVGEDIFALYKLLDLGDHIGVRGHLMRTRTGELTLKALPAGSKPAISFLSKAMIALPDKYHGLEDVELRYRQRYVDLIMNSGTLAKQEQATNPGAPPTRSPGILSADKKAVILSEGSLREPESKNPATADPTAAAEPISTTNAEPESPRNVRDVFVKRAAILRAIRRFFDDRGYLEVETPMMHTIAGGAAARPFRTHHNALDIGLSLRIAPELYLKRLVVGGLDRVYEINRNFRNEGVSTQHNPEFTMLEFYQAYANYHDLMDLTQELITTVAKEVNGTAITNFNGNEIDLSKWQKLSMREAIVKFWPKNFGTAPTEKSFDTIENVRALYLQLLAGDFNIGHPDYGPSAGNLGKLIAELFEFLAEEHLIQPTIIYDFPLAVSPLSKVKPDEPDWVERFEFYIGGFEVGNAFSELNDPDDQRRRFEDQLKERDRGDDEAHQMDEDYVRALSFGLPPTAGEGIGIDRLTMILTGARSIRDVILFPLMRPINKTVADEDEGDGHTHGESAE